ncbi:efflux RND transporter periplasmic adaptor subunit [Cellvibrio sp. KY-GH-1]|uniref:efflux RND transporter periplasmic adaptor subunit n=1 Tax=Cellvibrio sp. KY-GH-1 TaxID=2303332 RepID=UPI001246A89E|nr:efflux RND transporter periplasmic adaptor subunit [Cellvibrio sp. KY-GH-1]QEY18035.1 efflux RND transporter periplasmic adaptor subunit [Cellvibrio sp. KY-GH-1]
MTNKDELLSQLRINRDQQPAGESKTHLWVGGGVALLLLTLGVSYFNNPAPVKVQVEMARMAVPDSSSATVLDATGYVVARRISTVSSKVTGRVAEIFIEEGQQVEKDQVVARLDDSNTAKAVELSRAEWRSAKTLVTETQARLTEAKLTLERTTELARTQLVSAAALDKARADFDSLRAQLDARNAEVDVSQKRLALQQQNLDDLTLRAPFAGVVISKDSQPGEMISPMSAGGGFTRTGICTLVDMASLEIEVDVNESYIQRVRNEQFVQAVLEAYPEWKIPAKVIAIIPAADRQKATVKVRIGFQVSDPRILPDMGVKVAFLNAEPVVDEKPKEPLGVRVPISAVRNDGENKFIFVVKDGVAELRKVTLNASYGTDIYIGSGLRPGEDFVVEVTPELKDGAKVELQ